MQDQERIVTSSITTSIVNQKAERFAVHDVNRSSDHLPSHCQNVMQFNAVTIDSTTFGQRWK
jgi:hypothetical protein